MTHRSRMLAILVPTAMIQMIMRVDDVRYLLRPKSGEVQLSGDGLLRGLRRIGPSDGVANVLDIEAGIEKKPPFLMIDENAIDREAIHPFDLSDASQHGEGSEKRRVGRGGRDGASPRRLHICRDQ